MIFYIIDKYFLSSSYQGAKKKILKDLYVRFYHSKHIVRWNIKDNRLIKENNFAIIIISLLLSLFHCKIFKMNKFSVFLRIVFSNENQANL